MANPLYNLLSTRISLSPSTAPSDPLTTSLTSNYLQHLTSLSLDELSNAEPVILSQSSHSSLISLQSLCSRSYKSVIKSSNDLKTLSETIPSLRTSTRLLEDAIPGLDEEAVQFSTFYNRSNTENAVLDRRKKAMLLSRNIDRLAEILELPSLLSTTIAAAASSNTGTGAGIGTPNYSSALDLFAHIKRLHIMYLESPIVRSVLAEAEIAMKEMTSNLISSLRTQQNIRLAAAIRTIGWLRRVAPELTGPASAAPFENPLDSRVSGLHFNPGPAVSNDEGHYGALFLVCRLANLISMLEALSPLRDLADQETEQRYEEERASKVRDRSGTKAITAQLQPRQVSGNFSSAGQQTERYLKRYIEIFREQSFATISMYRNIFQQIPLPEEDTPSTKDQELLLSLPTALATFPMHLVDMLMEILQTYMPNVRDSTARESLLMQVLYAAGSLGRLGADFSMFIAFLGDEDVDDEDGDESEDATPSASIDLDKLDGGRTGTGNGDDEIKDGNSTKNEIDQRTRSKRDVKAKVPEWAAVMKKHRIQSQRLEALAKSGTGTDTIMP